MNLKMQSVSNQCSIETNRIFLESVTKCIASSVILDAIDFSLDSGTITSLMGPNGCGKTTLLKILSGLDDLSSGTIRFGDSISSRPRIGFVFQDARLSLYPWQTVAQHFEFGLQGLSLSKEERALRIEETLRLLGLSSQKHLYPFQLSGGMAQLTAIGRALICEPDLILFDEPFSALDYYTSVEIQKRFLGLWSRKKTTTLIITHTLEEAVLLSDRILVFSPKPSKIIADIPIPLPRPRTPKQIGEQNFRVCVQDVFKNLSGFLV